MFLISCDIKLIVYLYYHLKKWYQFFQFYLFQGPKTCLAGQMEIFDDERSGGFSTVKIDLSLSFLFLNKKWGSVVILWPSVWGGNFSSSLTLGDVPSRRKKI